MPKIPTIMVPKPKPTFFYVYEHEWGWIRRLVPLAYEVDPDIIAKASDPDEALKSIGADTVSIEKVTDPDEIATARKWLEPLASEFTRESLRLEDADGILRVTNRVGLDLETATDLVGRIYSFPFSDRLLDAIIDEYGANGSAMSLFCSQWFAGACVEQMKNEGR